MHQISEKKFSNKKIFLLLFEKLFSNGGQLASINIGVKVWANGLALPQPTCYHCAVSGKPVPAA